MEIALKPEHERLLEDWIESGKYASIEEALGDILEARSLDEKKLAWLREELQKGVDQLDRGEYIELRTPEDFKAFAASINREGLERLVTRSDSGSQA